MKPYRLIAIHGAPRSGTSWLGEIFNSSEHVAYRYQPFFSYAFRGRIDSESDAAQMRGFFDDLLQSSDPFVMQTGEARLAKAALHFRKGLPTHLVYKEVRFHDLIRPILGGMKEARCIGLVRDPRAALSSWRHAPREFHADWSFADEWRHAPSKNADLMENWYGFERWKALTSSFLQLTAEFPGRFRVQRYETLVDRPLESVSEMFAFCGLTVGAQTKQFLHDSTMRDDGDPYGVFRRHRQGEGNRYLPPNIASAIERELKGTALHQFLEPAA